MSDLVERLREADADPEHIFSDERLHFVCNEAADRLEAIEAENKRLRACAIRLTALLEQVQREGCENCGGDCGSANPPVGYCPVQERASAITEARAALSTDGGEG